MIFLCKNQDIKKFYLEVQADRRFVDRRILYDKYENVT